MFECLMKMKRRILHRWIYRMIAAVYFAAAMGLDKGVASGMLAGLYLML